MSMGPPVAVSSRTNDRLHTLNGFLHQHPAAKALAQFSRLLDQMPPDVLSQNMLAYITQPLTTMRPQQELLSRIHHAKHRLATCLEHLAEVVAPTVKNRVVVAHPFTSISAPLLTHAKEVRFVRGAPCAMHMLPAQKTQHYRSVRAPAALDGADLVVFEPTAITPTAVVMPHGARLFGELAVARGIPLYVVATSWHVAPHWQLREHEEVVPHTALKGVFSEQGMEYPGQFLARAQNIFPWMR